MTAATPSANSTIPGRSSPPTYGAAACSCAGPGRALRRPAPSTPSTLPATSPSGLTGQATCWGPTPSTPSGFGRAPTARPTPMWSSGATETCHSSPRPAITRPKATACTTDAPASSSSSRQATREAPLFAMSSSRRTRRPWIKCADSTETVARCRARVLGPPKRMRRIVVCRTRQAVASMRPFAASRWARVRVGQKA